jgi:hypothetical protein
MKSLKFLGVIALLAGSLGCVPNWARENETGFIMEVARVTAARGGETGTGTVLYSDVSQWINDNAILRVVLIRKNPNVQFVGPLEDVRLDSYQVRYFRSDGRNVEGLDVPYRFTGALNSVRLPAPEANGVTEVEVAIEVVRHTAKREAPLINLIDSDLAPNGRALLLTGEGIISTTAEITLYGRQVSSGDPIMATGHLPIAFADFVDNP